MQQRQQTVVWNHETGEILVLSFDQQLQMVLSGVIIWCEKHQCFHYVTQAQGDFSPTRH